MAFDGSTLKRQHDLYAHDGLDPRSLGAVGNDSANDTVPIQGALNASSQVYLSAGTYRITQINPRANQIIRGDGPGYTILKESTNGNSSMIAFPSTADDVTIQDLTIDGNRANQTPGGQIHGIVTNANTARVRIRNVSILSTYDNGIALGASNADTWIEDCYLSDIGRSGMYLSGSRARVRNCTILNPGARIAAVGIQLATLVDSSLHGNFISGPTDDCITLTTSSVRNLITQNNLQTATLSGLETDTTSVDNVIQGNLLKSNTQHGLHVTGRQQILGNLALLNGRAGIKCNGSTPFAYPIVKGNLCRDNGAAAAEQYGIELTGTVTDAVIMGNICTDTGAGTQTVGIGLNNSTDYCIVTGNDLRANVTSALTFTSGTHNIIRGNLGYNPQGIAAITVTASPFTYTNNDNVTELVYISGGTVSAMTKDSITLFGVAGDASVWLEPGESVTITYAVAPTMNKDRK